MTPRPTRASDPIAFWETYYANPKHAETPAQVLETVTLLRSEEQFRDIEGVLRGYLRHHTRHAEPWMYEMLALAIEMNQGDPEEVKTLLGYAADLAERRGDPNALISAADLLFLRGHYDRVGRLLDLAAETVPHRAEPGMMSVNLALKTENPDRMAEAAERLLSLGWPGVDDALRREVRRHVEALAQTLRENGRGDDAETLLVRLEESEARDLFVRLSWTGAADLDLIVEEPLGASARYQTPRTVFGGALLQNGYGTQADDTPEEIYACPRGFDGEYRIRVEVIYNDPENPVTEATLEIITREGTSEEQTQTHPLTLRAPAHAEDSEAPSDEAAPGRIKPVTVTLEGGRRRTVLPFVAPSPTIVAQPIPVDPDRPPRTDAAEGATSRPVRRPIDPEGRSPSEPPRQPLGPTLRPPR